MLGLNTNKDNKERSRIYSEYPKSLNGFFPQKKTVPVALQVGRYEIQDWWKLWQIVEWTKNKAFFTSARGQMMFFVVKKTKEMRIKEICHKTKITEPHFIDAPKEMDLPHY